MQWLIAHGSDATKTDDRGLLPIHYAAQACGLFSSTAAALEDDDVHPEGGAVGWFARNLK